MACSKLHVADAKYQHWIRVSLSLQYTKEGLEDYVDYRARYMHSQLLKTIYKNSSIGLCSVCVADDIKRKHRNWKINCQSNVCDVWVRCLEQESARPEHIIWENSDIQKWPTDYWEVIKVFQPFGCKMHNSTRDDDIYDVLKLLKNCMFFSSYVSITDIEDVIETRNKTMHSPDLVVEELDMKQELSTMIRLLQSLTGHQEFQSLDIKIATARLHNKSEEVQNLQTRKEIKKKVNEEISRITQLRDGKLDLTLNKKYEKDALGERLTAIERDNQWIQRQIDSNHTYVSNRVESLETNVVAHSKQIDEYGRQLSEQDKKIEHQDRKHHEQNKLFNEDNKKLNEHETILDEHGTILDEHAERHDAQDRLIDEHCLKLHEHEDMLDLHTVKLDEHNKRQDDQDRIRIEHEQKLHEYDTKQNEYEKRHDSQDTLIQEHNIKLGEHEAKLDEQAKRHEDHNRLNIKHEQKIIGYDKKLSEHQTKLEEHQKKHNSQDTYITEHKRKLGEIETKLDEHAKRQEDHEQITQKHDHKFSKYDAKMSEHEQKHDSQDRYITEQRRKLDEHEVKLDEHDKRQEEYDRIITKHDQKLSEYDAKLGEHDEKHDSQDKYITEHNKKFNEYEAKLSEHDKRQDNHNRSIEDHDQKLCEYGTKIEEHDKKHVKHQTSLDEHEKRIDEYASKLNECGKQIYSLSKRTIQESQSVKDEKANVTTGLQDTLLEIYSQNFQRTPPTALKPIWNDHLEDMYVVRDLNVIDRWENTGSSDTSMYTDTQSEPNIQKPITCVKDIFYTGSRMHKNIYISGEAGVGKTTYCESIVKLWCDAHSATDQTQLTKNQASMLDFSLLFYINLRGLSLSPQASQTDEVADLIHERLELSEICSRDDIREYLSSPSTLVLMDSLDEFQSKRIPRRGLHNRSSIVIFSRPWKIEALRYQFEYNVDKHIEIEGLNEESPMKIAKHIVRFMNKMHSQNKNVELFPQDMAREGLQHFLYIPMFLINMVVLWYNGECVGNTQYHIYCRMIHYQILTAVNTNKVSAYEGRSKKEFPIGCSLPNCPCKMYGKLLWKLSKLAYHTLFGRSDEFCLIFDRSVTEYHNLTADEIEICLDLGIITQHRVIGVTFENKSVSFPHKTNQEYLASVYLSNEGKHLDVQHLCSVISNLDRALELEKVLFFCSQLNPNVARKLSLLISIKADEDERLHEYRQSLDRNAPHKDLVAKIQAIILPATNYQAKLFLSDVVFSPSEHETMCNVKNLDMTIVKSIQISGTNSVDPMFWVKLKKAESLQKLALEDIKINVKGVFEMISRNKNTLTTLGLFGNGSDNKLDLHLIGDKLKKVLGNKLRSFGFGEGNISHEQCKILARHIMKTDHIMHLELSHLTCTSHKLVDQCVGVIDLTQQKHLVRLALNHLPLTDVNLHAENLTEFELALPGCDPAVKSILRCLISASNLQVFRCLEITTESSADLLVTILPHLSNLRAIVLHRVNFEAFTEIRLSFAMEYLQSLMLLDCKISGAGLRYIINSLPSHRVAMHLKTITVIGGSNFVQEIRYSPYIEVIDDDDEIIFENGQWKIGSLKFYTGVQYQV